MPLIIDGCDLSNAAAIFFHRQAGPATPRACGGLFLRHQ